MQILNVVVDIWLWDYLQEWVELRVSALKCILEPLWTELKNEIVDLPNSLGSWSE